jgi:hypothetical protein
MIAWPRAKQADGTEIDLSIVPGLGARTALKLQAAIPSPAATPGASAAVINTPDGSSLTITWDPSGATAAAMWLDHGGWPAEAGRRQVSIGPTTSPHDDLASAIAAGRALVLDPGTSRSWEVRITLRSAQSKPEPVSGS